MHGETFDVRIYPGPVMCVGFNTLANRQSQKICQTSGVATILLEAFDCARSVSNLTWHANRNEAVASSLQKCCPGLVRSDVHVVYRRSYHAGHFVVLRFLLVRLP